MSVTASQIACNLIICSTGFSCQQQWQHQNCALPVLCKETQECIDGFPTKGEWCAKCFHFETPYRLSIITDSEGHFNIKMPASWYRNPHYKDKTVSLFYLYNEIIYRKRRSLYWNSALVTRHAPIPACTRMKRWHYGFMIVINVSLSQ